MNSITNYFSKQTLVFNESQQPERVQQQQISSDQSISSIPTTSDQDTETSSFTSILTNENDIGLFVGNKISDENMYRLLTNHFEPNDQFKWPYSESNSMKNGQNVTEKRYLNKSHLDNHKWLKYSLNKKGLYCVPCALFSTTTKQIETFGKLVNKPLNDYKRLFGKHGYITVHSRSKYHQNNMSKAEQFLYMYKNPDASIEMVLDNKRRRQILENRERLKPIVETILVCGRLNFPLRGHRDDGKLLFNEESIIERGNFRALLQYRVDAGDHALREHLQSCDRNATYISKTTQNQLIQVIGDVIIKNIIEEVKQAKFFTILLDETADIANIQQARYINGCQAIIKQKYPQILYVHCASHCLNLALSDSCSIRAVENTIGTIKEVYNFFHSSTVRTELLNNEVNVLNSKRKELQNEINNQAAPDQHIVLKNLKTKIANVCITRWVERHTSVDTFYSLYPAIIEVFQDIIDHHGKEVSTKAHMFFNSSLQNSKIDLIECLNAIDDVIQVIQMIRNDPDEEYKFIFEEATELAGYTGTIIKMPRLAAKQQYRNNIPATNEYEYYKLSLFIPLLDYFLVSLKDRFCMHVKHAASISCIIPKFIHNKTFDDILPAIQLYQSLLPGSITNIKSEFLQWKNKWTGIYNESNTTTNSLNNNASVSSKKRKLITIPDTAIDAFNECNEAFYPNIKALLCIFSTLPVTTASVERSFSVLKLIKSYLRSTISESRLNGLALMYIYRDMPIDVETIITEFSKTKHRINFCI
ncbi:unnamed protein product [Rotaria sordida]|uniref:HAT C-terminal dimerisation domain-containing protein n=1 Tax=Rotaria sordida TaxID=392033 RepID=A0A814SDC8_9BILA|nr:unnamed protein product [Rotaria sordida]